MIIDYHMTNKFASAPDIKLPDSQRIASPFLGWGRQPPVNHPTFRETFAGTPTEIGKNPNPGQSEGNNADTDKEMLKLAEKDMRR